MYMMYVFDRGPGRSIVFVAANHSEWGRRPREFAKKAYSVDHLRRTWSCLHSRDQSEVRVKFWIHSIMINPWTTELFFSCDQAALWMVQSVRLSVRPSVCHTFLTMFPWSYHHEILRSYYQWQKWCPCKRSRSEVKGQGHWGHWYSFRRHTSHVICFGWWGIDLLLPKYSINMQIQTFQLSEKWFITQITAMLITRGHK